ncbi:MAG: hypothetical protein UX37_C0019G0010 [Microgenomates group bacterium GW2011_GWA2_46_16]|nr:MAG: hypothetical protein UX37_C0019G0010 [Microgenomates group bacterium GW2011_GWA2_46_16]
MKNFVFIETESAVSALLFQVPGVVRFEQCNPAEVLRQIACGETIAPTCPICGALLPREGNNFKRCPCSVVHIA